MIRSVVYAGERYGKWTVVVAGKPKSLCRCECGNENYVVNKNMVRGGSKQCLSCARRETNKLRRKKLTEGQKFGKWTVLKDRPCKSLCRCECGRKKLVANSHLTLGASTQCDLCYRVTSRYMGPKIGVTPQVYRKLCSAARSAIARCTDPSHRQFRHYGGRGIKVYEPWLNDTLAFIKYLASLPGHDNFGLWLDRENNDNGYMPGNLRFVTPSVSNLNKRKLGRRRYK